VSLAIPGAPATSTASSSTVTVTNPVTGQSATVQVTPQDPATGVLVGAASAKNYETQFGDLPVHRTYKPIGAWPKDFASSEAGPDVAKGRISFWSNKGATTGDADWLAMAAGKYDAQILPVLTSVPKPHALKWIYHHEPNGGGSGGADGKEANYLAAQIHARILVDQANVARGAGAVPIELWGVLICNGATPLPGWFPGAGVWDGVGMDGYQWTTAYKSPASIFDPSVALAHEHGLKFAITEFGTVAAPTRVGWIKEVRAYAATVPGHSVQYWNTVGTRGDFTLTGAEIAAALH
jgi:hypothetical protein